MESPITDPIDDGDWFCCPVCDGTGKTMGITAEPCYHCRGRGEIWVDSHEYPDDDLHPEAVAK